MLIPLNDYVIIKRTETEEKSAGGIVLPGSEQEKPNTGIVISTANDAVWPGNTVIFGKYAGKEIKLNGETVLIVEFKELIAKVGVE